MIATAANPGQEAIIGKAAIATTAERLDLPPPPGARVRLSSDFGRRFLIFADAEEEFDWTKPFQREATSTAAIASLPAANRRFTDRGVIPTYMVDFPVAANEASAAAMRKMVDAGECDIGTQLHPWVNPPHEEEVTSANSYVGTLPEALEKAKLKSLTEMLAATFGTRPVCYRAGRYGIGANTARLLTDAGYRLDVSVRALFDYRAGGGPDFSRHPIWPYRVNDQLFELPLTTGYVGLLRAAPSLYRAEMLRGPLARTGLLSRVPLTPEGTPLNDALNAIRRLLDDGVQLFSLSFHTPTVEIGHTPYVRDEADLRAFWQWWDGVLDLLERENVRPIRSGEIVSALQAV